jgi:neutral ceramidase
MKAGFAEIIITPQDRCLLAGYGLPWSTGVHDDLFASAVYFQDGDARALLISFDLLAMERDLIARLKAAIQAALPIPSGHIFFSCTHTHEGPEVRERKFRDHWGLHERPDYLDGYQRFLGERCAEVALAAGANAQEFDLVANRAWVDENVNRRFFLTDETVLSIPGNKQLLDVAREHADKELGVLSFCPPGERRPFGLLLNYTMHPLTAGNTSTLISADVPGIVRAVVRESIGCPACYVTGAAGDNHPKHSEAGFAETRRVGEVLGSEAVRRSSDGHLIPGPIHLKCLTRTIPLRYRSWEDFQSIPLHGLDERELAVNFKRVERPGEIVDVEFALLAIGPVLFIGVPGELLAELGSVLKWFSPFKRTYVMYQATESLDYIAHPNAFLWGGFEIVCAQLSPDSVRPLINAILDAAEELSRQPAGAGGDPDKEQA